LQLVRVDKHRAGLAHT